MAKLQDKDFEQVSGGIKDYSVITEGISKFSNKILMMLEETDKQLASPGLSDENKKKLQMARMNYMNALETLLKKI